MFLEQSKNWEFPSASSFLKFELLKSYTSTYCANVNISALIVCNGWNTGTTLKIYGSIFSTKLGLGPKTFLTMVVLSF